MKRLTAVLLAIMMLVLPSAVFAEGAASLSFSGDTSANVGEVFAVVVTFSAEENIAALQAEFTYDDGMMRFLSGGNSAQAEDGTGTISGSGGAQSLSYSLEFRAMKAGEASIDIGNVEVISDDTGMMLGSPSGSVNITITEKTAAPVEEETDLLTEEEAAPTEEETETDVPEAELIVIGDRKYVPTDAEITGYMLLGDEEGKLWLYRTSDGMMTEYAELNTTAMYRYIEQPELSGYEKTTAEIFGEEREVYAAKESGCYYVYLQDHGQDAAWYGYSEADGLLRKAEIAEYTVETTVENENTVLLDVITLILAGLCVASLIGLILVLRRKRR